ncbi:hypothetical protein GQ457_18G023820 [Hibiscus cannabinus]
MQKGEKQAWEQEKQPLDGQKSREQRDGKQKVGEQQQKQEHQVVSVFVENIPKAMHWKGLWHTFARHGDVIGSFIARKLSRGGKRFGFVRMKNRADALRVIERLNGFMLYGFRLTVNLARPYKEIYKKKNYEMGGINYRKIGLPRLDFEAGNQRDIPKRISGHVDDEELWRLRRCLVGEMSSVCSTRSIALRLQDWGLGEINAQGSEEACYQLGESEQIGGTFKDQPAVVSENLEKQPGEMEKTRGIECDQIVCTSSKGLNWAEAVKKNLNETDDRPSLIQIAKDESQVIEAENLLYAKAVEDVSNMGCKLTGPNNESWAKEIENKMNTGWDPNTKLSDKSSGTHTRKILSKSKKGKRYGSLLELQDKAISGTERKKRDRAWRRLRLNKKDLEVSELSGRSLSESDLEVRWALATKEARKVLALGKNIGMQIVGDEQEVINELANLEEEVRRLWYDDEVDFRFSAAEGRSGGLISVWDKNVFQVESSVIHKRFIFLKGKWLKQGFITAVLNIYGPCVLSEQVELWETLVVGRLVGNGLGTLVVRDSKDLILDLYNTIFLVQTSYVNIAIAEVVAHSGTATFYTAPYVPSACYGYEDDGVMIAAASDAIWDGGAVCGRQYKVKCKGATNESPHPCRGQDYVVVKIVDYCPSGCQGTIDLSQEAFAAIADPDAGKIKIYFHQYVNLYLHELHEALLNTHQLHQVENFLNHQVAIQQPLQKHCDQQSSELKASTLSLLTSAECISSVDIGSELFIGIDIVLEDDSAGEVSAEELLLVVEIKGPSFVTLLGTCKDAFRAIERLNGYPLYGSHIAVSLARFNGRSSYWRKVRFVPERDGEKSGFQSKKSEVEILLGETSNGTACTVKKEHMVAGEVSALWLTGYKGGV